MAPHWSLQLNIKAYMSAVPEFDRYLRIDELNQDFERIANDLPDITRWERVGSSGLGEPIHMLSIGSGEKNILLFGCPHPNEPIGAMMLHHLARTLCDDVYLRDGLGFTWNLIPCVDPDSTRLNEGWFGGPFTVENYARHYYGPGQRQVDWSFPNFYKQNYFDQSLRETQMLMRVIDDLQPELMGSLHNAEFGGVYYYISRDEPALYPTFHELPKLEHLTLRLGEPEVPYAEEFSPAIFKLMSVADTYDYMDANGNDMSTFSRGESSAEYASKHETLTLVVEMPYFDDDRVNNQTITESNRRAAILTGIEISAEGNAEMKRHMDAVSPELRTRSGFEEAVCWSINDVDEMTAAQRSWAESDPLTDRAATVAELFSNDQEPRFRRLVALGMLVRLLEGEVATGNSTPVIRTHLDQALAKFSIWSAELEADLDMRAIPIRQLVAVQLGAFLSAAQHLSARHTDSDRRA